MKLKELQSTAADVILGLFETKESLFLREARNIRVIDKSTFTEKGNFSIELDGIMGYKRIQFNSGVVFTTVHSKYDPDNPNFGKADFVELIAISKVKSYGKRNYWVDWPKQLWGISLRK